MPLKKSELYASLWKSCDELRGGMDASQYKDYVLVLLFVKYVSDNDIGCTVRRLWTERCGRTGPHRIDLVIGHGPA
ncbi:type I restriction-modification system subunit M N-terminal domain-containing protein [Acidithiobacillus ferrooxidans]|uniref:type I restriction-modification system subunit M N-terminal domain-containing protein n=1 Tax=Acidithiobacillus ferrooxidans TaxID=920 RepID=UPI001941674E|nr:type I restriction-modification system subunit M N-terminal domain-containing protein [Acidithiobacillus ferrooxidans]